PSPSLPRPPYPPASVCISLQTLCNIRTQEHTHIIIYIKFVFIARNIAASPCKPSALMLAFESLNFYARTLLYIHC
ncbi:MAG: hypothetical protein ACK55Z_23420, partial [bacterium]